MPKPRYAQVSLDNTPYYHCVSRCVRRAFLCGKDVVSSKSYEHRREWLEEKLLCLTEVFAIDICAYAVMSNHYHVVLYIDQEETQAWSFDEVIDRWHQLFSGNLLSQRYVNGEVLGHAEKVALSDCVEVWRSRLMDISWFMRILNEDIARRSNAEDHCIGRFGPLLRIHAPTALEHPCSSEGRYKCQALLDESALLACMAYVDLNPVRAKMAKKPESSDYTSVKQRAQKAETAHAANSVNQQAKRLLPFVGNPREDMPKGLPFRLTDYLEVVDWSGRIIREDKKGCIDSNIPSILERLNIETKHWTYMVKNFESRFKTLVGAAFKLKQACESLGYIRTPGLRACESYFL